MTLIALYKEKNRTKYLCFRYGTTSHVTLPMLGPLMFDILHQSLLYRQKANRYF